MNVSAADTTKCNLEAEQIPAADSVKLLEEEIEREELRIEDRRQLLAELEANAEIALRQQKKRSKAVCRPLHFFVQFLSANNE